MPSIYVFKRVRKGKPDKGYTAEIRFGKDHGNVRLLRSTGASDRREAEAAARRIAREIEESELPRRGAEHLTLEKMIERWIRERGHEMRSGKDIRWQVKLLVDLIGGLKEVREIGNKDVSAFISDAKLRKLGPVPINRCISRLRSTMNYAHEMWEEPIKAISWKKMMQDEPGAREIYLSPEEAQLIMTLLPRHIALAFAFTLYTGCRLDELQTLEWNRVDATRMAISVITKGRGAKVKTRTVWLSQKALRVLAEIRGDRINPRGPVFDLTNRRRSWDRARTEIGRPDVTWHDLRGMTATWARQFAKADMRLISATLGHSDTKVTERYARVVDREIVTMLDQLPEVEPHSPQQNLLSLTPIQEVNRGNEDDFEQESL